VADSEFSDIRKRLTGAATVSTYRLGSLAARLMPGPVAAGASASIGFGASFANPARRRMVERHLQRVNPKLRGAGLRVAVQQAFDYYARYYVESFRLPTMSNAAVARPFTIEGWERVLEGLDAGSGVILALPHLGGWEWAGRWMTDQGFKMTVVVEALDPPELFEWFADLRKDLGMTVVPTGPKAGPAVLKALRANGIEVTALHNHMLADDPRLFFMHFWANDAADKVATGLRAALDNVSLAGGGPKTGMAPQCREVMAAKKQHSPDEVARCGQQQE
jgi:lauroyl/myristoyl acyltransferase